MNTRFLRRKTADILQHIYEQSVDLCVITETWLQPEADDVVRGELSQDGYCFDDVPRPDQKGGGLALLYRSNLKVSKCFAKQFTSFECAEWKVCSNSFILYIVGIYRPPYSERHPVTQAMFITEFTEFLEQISTIYALFEIFWTCSTCQCTY